MTNDFDKNGYIHLTQILDVESCNNLTNNLKSLVKENKIVKDTQCPLSKAIYGSEIFDQLLIDLLPHFEKVCNKKLLPTYSYARLYKPGEELKKHTDREACEISATVTLGFEGDVWSIYMAGNKVDMQVGDAVLYRGMDIEHWREPYTEGQWQAQVFLHYVDAHGSHADQIYDGRDSIGFNNNNVLTNFAIFPNHVSDTLCNMIIDRYKQNDIKKTEPYIGLNSHNKIDKSIRDTLRVELPPNQGIGATLTATALNANHYWWKYNITHANQTEVLIYNPDGHYTAHIDTLHQHSNDTRKLTAIAFLNDDYEGGRFFINPEGKTVYPPQEKGTVLVFPSYMVHGVEPVTKGVRYSAVTWLVGPYFK